MKTPPIPPVPTISPDVIQRIARDLRPQIRDTPIRGNRYVHEMERRFKEKHDKAKSESRNG